MAEASDKMHCKKCEKTNTTSKCAGCLEEFCFDHLAEHRQQLTTQLDEIEMDRYAFRQTLLDKTNSPNESLLIKQVDQWEYSAIKQIQQMANKCRQLVIEHISQNIHQVEVDLEKLTDQLKQLRQEDNFNELELQQSRKKLTELAEIFDKPAADVVITSGSTPVIYGISVAIVPHIFYAT